MLLGQNTITHSVMLARSLRLVDNKEHRDHQLAFLAVQQKKPTVVSWLNAHAFTVAQKDREFASNLCESSVLFRDGIGISVLLRLMQNKSGINMNGTDCIPRIIKLYEGRTVALLGTREPYLSRAAAAAEKMGVKVVLRLDGFQEPEFYAQQLALHPAELVILGMGVPKQEKVANFLAAQFKTPFLILTGGAILDFMAERFARAPLLWRRARMEWLFRMIQEPKRLGRRYIVGGIVFLFYTVQVLSVTKWRAFLRRGKTIMSAQR